MGDATITAKTIGNPSGGMADDPWPAGHPAEGERVAIFAYDVTSVDGVSENIRTYHVAPWTWRPKVPSPSRPLTRRA